MPIIFNALPVSLTISKYNEPFYRSIQQTIKAINLHTLAHWIIRKDRTPQATILRSLYSALEKRLRVKPGETSSIQPYLFMRFAVSAKVLEAGGRPCQGILREDKRPLHIGA
jgi:hypothetical protein